MYKELEKINTRPLPFEFYTAGDLWNNEYTSKQMLSYHLNEKVDVSSRNIVFIDKSVEWITSHFNVRAGTKIVDFGCGPGLYSIRLAKHHAEVTGIDFSTRSIQYARKAAIKEGLSINYINRNYLEYDTSDRFDLIIMIMCDFCALSPEQRKKILTKFYTILKPGGSVLLDVYSLKAFGQRIETCIYEVNLLNGFWSPNKYYGFLNTFKYDREKVILDKYTIIEDKRTHTVFNWLQYFSPAELEKEFTDCKLNIKSFYSDVAGKKFDPENSEFAVVAQKSIL